MDHADLRALAEAARAVTTDADGISRWAISPAMVGTTLTTTEASRAHVAYIAAADPATVLALLDEIAELRRLLDVEATAVRDRLTDGDSS